MTGTLPPGTTQQREPASVPASAPTGEDAVATAVSPTVRRTARRAVPWIVLGVIALLVALSSLALGAGRSIGGDPLSTTNPGPVGSKALAQVLGQQGVTVKTAASLAQVRDAAGDDTTVLVYDPEGNLDHEGYDQLTSVASTIVVVEPHFAALQALAPTVHAAGGPGGAASADCDLPAAQRAARIDPRATTNTDGASAPGTFRASGDATACFEGSGGRASLVETSYQGRTVYLLGSAAVLMNEILGGGTFTSRLFKEVRETRGLAYGVSSSLVNRDHSNLLLISTATRSDRAAETLAIVRDTVKRLAEEGPTQAELDATKKYMIGAYAINNLDSSSSIAATLVELQVDKLGIDYMQRRAGLINAVTLDDVKAAAAKLLSVEPTIMLVGPKSDEANKG